MISREKRMKKKANKSQCNKYRKCTQHVGRTGLENRISNICLLSKVSSKRIFSKNLSESYLDTWIDI